MTWRLIIPLTLTLWVIGGILEGVYLNIKLKWKIVVFGNLVLAFFVAFFIVSMSKLYIWAM